MANVGLCLATLGELDHGASEAIIDAAIREAVLDIDDRGEDGKPRQVNILLTLTKLDNGLIAAHVEAQAKTPKRRTASTLGAVKTANGGIPTMAFQTLAPDDPKQSTIDNYTKEE